MKPITAEEEILLISDEPIETNDDKEAEENSVSSQNFETDDTKETISPLNTVDSRSSGPESTDADDDLESTLAIDSRDNNQSIILASDLSESTEEPTDRVVIVADSDKLDGDSLVADIISEDFGNSDDFRDSDAPVEEISEDASALNSQSGINSEKTSQPLELDYDESIEVNTLERQLSASIDLDISGVRPESTRSFSSAGIPAPSLVSTISQVSPEKIVVPASIDQVQGQALAALKVLKVFSWS